MCQYCFGHIKVPTNFFYIISICAYGYKHTHGKRRIILNVVLPKQCCDIMFYCFRVIPEKFFVRVCQGILKR